MIHEVRLNVLPADVTVPEELSARFGYNPQRQRLYFDGFMSKSTFDRLLRLSRDEAYRRALEELFRISVPEDEVDGASRMRAVMIALMGILTIGGLTAVIVLAY